MSLPQQKNLRWRNLYNLIKCFEIRFMFNFTGCPLRLPLFRFQVRLRVLAGRYGKTRCIVDVTTKSWIIIKGVTALATA